MLADIIAIHHEVMSTIEMTFKRYLYSQINWDAQAICIIGDRGVGKTTLMCQRLLEHFKTVERALYISADNVSVAGKGLFKIAQEYFSDGGECLFIDEVHKYPNWAQEIKNILDTYKKGKVVFSASSSIDLLKSKADLSRRVVYHKLLGLSFREFIHHTTKISLPAYTFTEILHDHIKIAEELGSIKILKAFKEYLSHGYYPFFHEGLNDYLSKLHNVIEKVIFEDIAVVYNLRQTTLPVLKKLLWLVATTNGLVPNIDSISSSIGVSREIIYNCLEYLGHSGLLQNVYPQALGMKLIRKPGKIFLNNTNLLHAINGSLKRDTGVGGARETFFVNQVTSRHRVDTCPGTDFIVDDRYIIEVGGNGKDYNQIKDMKDSFLAVDATPIGYRNKIPLYLFGFLY
jgi:predicted AAA+ superfamily ATPase